MHNVCIKYASSIDQHRHKLCIKVGTRRPKINRAFFHCNGLMVYGDGIGTNSMSIQLALLDGVFLCHCNHLHSMVIISHPLDYPATK